LVFETDIFIATYQFMKKIFLIEICFIIITLSLAYCKKDTLHNSEIKTNCVTGMSRVRKVLIIGIDGCRTDALLQAASPAFDSLIAHGYVNLHCDRGPYTVSGPGWSTLLHGVYPSKHGVFNNDFAGHDYGMYHDLYYYLHRFNAAFSLSVVAHWGDFLRITTSEDYSVNVSSDAEVRDHALYLLNVCVPDVLLLHFDDVDAAGHSSGFSPDNSDYINAIKQTGVYTDEIMQAIKTREQTYHEEWMVIVVTDHGGNGTGHNNQDYLDETRFVFEIIRLPNIHRIDIPVASNVDIMPTILKYMDVPVDSTWNLDGVPLF
jgi:predicted AlkP superfamily pyrophosphatase or phosphodiesterase